MSKYAERIKNTITKGSNLHGGINALNNLSSIVLTVFLTKNFNLLTIRLAIKELKTIDIRIKVKNIKYCPKFNPKKFILVKSKNVTLNKLNISTINNKLL